MQLRMAKKLKKLKKESIYSGCYMLRKSQALFYKTGGKVNFDRTRKRWREYNLALERGVGPSLDG
jgi:hypothetical protein